MSEKTAETSGASSAVPPGGLAGGGGVKRKIVRRTSAGGTTKDYQSIGSAVAEAGMDDTYIEELRSKIENSEPWNGHTWEIIYTTERQPLLAVEDKAASDRLIAQALAAYTEDNSDGEDAAENQEAGDLLDPSPTTSPGATTGTEGDANKKSESKPTTSDTDTASIVANVPVVVQETTTKSENTEAASAPATDTPTPTSPDETPLESTSSKKNKFSKQIEFRLCDVNPHIVCKLCAGYFIGATTIMECLHTFCKSCIVKHFHAVNTCPTCGIVVHETNPLDMLRADRTVQAIVYKIVKNLQKDEQAREEEFYRSRGELNPNETGTEQKESASDAQPPPAQRRRVHNEASDQISFVLEALTENTAEEDKNDLVTSLEKPFIRTSSRATIIHLKKFLAKKLDLKNPEDVDILCKGEVLGKEFTLEFIARTRWRNGDQLVLTYRPRVDIDLL